MKKKMLSALTPARHQGPGGFTSLNAMLRIEVVKMSKIVVDKCADEKDAVWLKIPKESAFYNFLMEGEFDDADKEHSARSS